MGRFKSFFNGFRAVVRKTDEVLDNPLIGGIVRTLPGGAAAAVAIDAANKLFPQPKAGDDKREAVLKALQIYHPEIDRDTAAFTIEQIVAAIKTLQKPKV